MSPPDMDSDGMTNEDVVCVLMATLGLIVFPWGLVIAFLCGWLQ